TAVAVLLNVYDQTLMQFFEVEWPPYVAYIAIGVAVATMVVGLIGIMEAIKCPIKIMCTFRLYLFILVVLFLFFLVICTMGGIYHGYVEGFFKDGMVKSADNYKTVNISRIAWDTLQEEFMCCGLEDSSD
ncbi:unnamed protein product, partial [Meganyctiphanes norvegica]